MKKIFVILLFLLLPLPVIAEEKTQVLFNECVDGDTAKFIMNKKEVKVRFLGIDTPEMASSNKKEEPYAREARNYTCRKLMRSKIIELEFDKKSDKKDKYNRYLAWVFCDGDLLQEKIVLNGYAEVKYLNGDYKYASIIKNAEIKAKEKKKGIYSSVDTSKYTSEKELKQKIGKSFKKFANKLKANIKDLFSEILDEIL